MKHSFFLLIFLFSLNVSSQGYPVQLYKTTKDFIENKTTKVYKAVVLDESNVHLTIKKVIDSITGKKVKNWNWAWAIKYNNKNYFNSSYVNFDSLQGGVYINIDVRGRYCLIIIDKDAPYIQTGNYYGGGLQGVLLESSTKWHKKWLNEKGEKKAILIIDTKIKNPQYINATAKILNIKRLKKLIKSSELSINIKTVKELSFEEVIEIIKLVNKKSKLKTLKK